ncbi:hypothetical protein [Bradyrhizobium sp. CCBAU 11386]|uniref:hypothetical protein n=1 Tax=Bradyrhizobium sp. CCBAU 11386 TaxID=1630837 RepID=UPI002302FCCB|nr:hypothetical protein [Bradyrhizobium sp. CCBAU 11386]
MSERTDGRASAQQAGFAGVTRKVLERLPLPGNHQELMVVEVTYPPGGTAPLHRHPVAGAVYIVEGVAESAYGSDEPRLRTALANFLRKRMDVQAGEKCSHEERAGCVSLPSKRQPQSMMNPTPSVCRCGFGRLAVVP